MAMTCRVQIRVSASASFIARSLLSMCLLYDHRAKRSTKLCVVFLQQFLCLLTVGRICDLFIDALEDDQVVERDRFLAISTWQGPDQLLQILMCFALPDQLTELLLFLG